MTASTRSGRCLGGGSTGAPATTGFPGLRGYPARDLRERRARAVRDLPGRVGQPPSRWSICGLHRGRVVSPRLPRRHGPRRASGRDPPGPTWSARRTPPALGAPRRRGGVDRIPHQDIDPSFPRCVKPRAGTRRHRELVPAVPCQHEVDGGRLIREDIRRQDLDPLTVRTSVECDGSERVPVDLDRGDGLRSSERRRDRAEPRARPEIDHSAARGDALDARAGSVRWRGRRPTPSPRTGWARRGRPMLRAWRATATWRRPPGYADHSAPGTGTRIVIRLTSVRGSRLRPADPRRTS